MPEATTTGAAIGGSLERTPVADVLKGLYAERATARVLFSRMGEERTVWIDRGQLISAASNREAQQVGELLRTFGLADESVLFSAFERALAEPGRGLAKALRETGAVPAFVADACVRALAEKLLFDTFRWASGAYTISHLEKAADPPVRFDQTNAALVLEGLRRLPSDAPRAGTRIDPRSRPVLARDILLRYQVATLLNEEAEALSRIDGMTSAADTTPDLQILERLRAIGVVQVLVPGQVQEKSPDDESAPVLNFEVAGANPNPRAAELQEQQASLVWNTYRRLDWATLYDIVGVPQTAGFEELRRAIHERARAFHPDNAQKANLGDAREALESLFRKVRTAETTFRTPELRAAYDRTLTEGGQLVSVASAGGSAEVQKSMARANYLRARDLYEQEDYYPAYEMIRQAVEFDPERAEYWILLSRVQRKNPKWLRQAAETLRRAALKLPENPDVWFELSEACAAERNEPERVKALKEVLKLDPVNRRAQAALAEIASMKPGK